MTMGIYGLFCCGECLYIGQSTNVESRWNTHRRLLKKNKHHNKELQSWVNQHSLKLIEYKLIEEILDGEKLAEREVFWFKKMQPKFWGRMPGETWRWSELSEQTLTRMNQNRNLKSKQFQASNILRSKRESIGYELNHEKYEQCQKWLSEGRNFEEIACYWNCSITTAKSIAKEFGLSSSKTFDSVKELDSMSVEELRRKYKEYKSQKLNQKQIAKEFNVGRSTLIRRLKKYGIS